MRRSLTDREAECFRQRLKSVLTALRITRTELGRRLGGKSSQYISQLLNGAARPSHRRVGEIEDALSLEPGTLTRVAPGGDAVAGGPGSQERLVDVGFQEWQGLMDTAGRMRAEGHLDTALVVLDRLVSQMQAVDLRGPHIDRLRAEAFILRAQLQMHAMCSEVAVRDAAEARTAATAIKDTDPGVFSRAYFWHLYCFRSREPRDRLVEIATESFPGNAPGEVAFLPLVIEAFQQPCRAGLPDDLRERLSQAIEGVPYTAEKATAYHMLQKDPEHGGEFGETWIAEAREAGDRVGLADALYHYALRGFMGAGREAAYTCLAEAIECAVAAHYEQGLSHTADLACQVLRLPMVDIVGEGEAELRSAADGFCARVCSTLREMGLRKSWLSNPRAYAWAAVLQCAGLRGDVERARESASQLLETHLAPGRKALTLGWAAEALARGGCAEGAEELWRSAIEHARSAIRAQQRLGIVMRDFALLLVDSRGDLELAAAALERSLAENSTDTWSWALLARTRQQLGDLVAAFDAADRAWDLTRFMSTQQGFMPLEMYRVPAHKEERRDEARIQALAWIRDVFTEAARNGVFSTTTQERAASAAEEIAEALNGGNGKVLSPALAERPA